MPGTNRAQRMQAELAIDAAKVAPAVAGSIVSVMGIPVSEVAASFTTLYVLILIIHHVITKWLWPLYRRWRYCRRIKSGHRW